MDPYIPIVIGVLIGMASAGIPAVLLGRTRERAFQKVIDAYSRIVDVSDRRFTSVMDRLHATKNLPPENVDMTVLHNERREEMKARVIERKNGGPLTPPPRIGLVDQVQNEMEKGISSGKYQRPA